MSTPTHYCIVRRDLPLGFLGAALIHAAGESYGVPPNTNAVCLGVDNEDHLRTIERQLQLSGNRHVSIREPDDPWEGALMSIGLVPILDRTDVRSITRGLKLL